MRKTTSGRGTTGWLFATALLLPLTTSAQIALTETAPDGRHRTRLMPPRDGGTGPLVKSAVMSYHGGPVLANGVTTSNHVNVYFIWYGSWTTKQQNILTMFASTIGASPYFNINTTYNDSHGTVQNSVNFAASTSYATTTLGTKLSDADIFTLVSQALASNALPTDPNGVYFVLTGSGIQETSGFLTQYCGWHDSQKYGSMNIQYAFVGDPAPSGLSACAWQTVSPNGDAGVDAMISIIAHELDEATSDPQLNTWYDSAGNESADKCAWTFGTTSTLPGGALYNVQLSGFKYLIQQNWVNAGAGSCALLYTGPPAPGALTVSASPTSESVTPGGTTGAYNLTAKSTVGYPGTVAYAVTTGLPAGATPKVSGSSITVSTTSATAPGTYNFGVEGTSDAALGTTTATLVVQPPVVTIGISPSSQSVVRPAAGSVTAKYTVTVSGGSGAVTLTASGVAPGVTLSLSQSSITGGGSVSLTATVASNAKKGADTLTVKAVNGNTSKSATATLQIN